MGLGLGLGRLAAAASSSMDAASPAAYHGHRTAHAAKGVPG